MGKRNMNLATAIDLTDQFLSCTHRLLTGPNKCLSRFGRIVEGTFRRDYLTLNTILVLAKMPQDQHVIYGNSCMDLSRRVFEDLVSLEFINLTSKEKLTKKFMDFKAVEAMRDIVYLQGAGVQVDQKLLRDTEKEFNQVKSKFHDKRSKDGVRKSWAGLDVESMIKRLLNEGIISPEETRTLLQTYQAGCYKNHFSPSDIFNFLFNDLFEFTNNGDLLLSLLSTLSSASRIAKIATDEIEIADDTKKCIDKIWQYLLNAHL